jgi:hypothetical protein
MPKMSIYVTGASISMYDNFNNRVSIRQTQTVDFKNATLIPEYSVASNDVKTDAYKLAASVMTYLKKPSKDNFQKRFKKLQNLLIGFNAHSFETLKNRLESHMNPKPAVA